MAFNSKPWLFALVTLALAFGCSHAPPKTTPELGKLSGKKVALVEVSGDPTASKVVEVALVNELMQRGTFFLIPKQDVEAARTAPAQDPTRWREIAKKSGADYALRARVLQFDADEHEGYSSEIVEDSQLAEEEGRSEAQSERLYKVKSLDGHVRIQLEFTDLSDRGPASTRTGTAEYQDRVVADARKSAIHLPPRLRFLEGLSFQAFKKFFDENQN